jgi:Holliday junction resolvase RusA-like endonuclease
MIFLTIPGKPIAKKRPRFVRRGNFVGAYNCQETEEGRFLLEVKRQLKGKPLEGPLSVTYYFFFPVPKGISKKKRELMLQNKIKHTKKPDRTNLEKFVEDCLNGIVWRDDAQVWSGGSCKLYAEEPRTVIEIEDAE